jgi:hypothetical protein
MRLGFDRRDAGKGRGARMDGDKFDDLSRSLAARVNRRDALKTAGKGGLLASVAGAIGIGSRGATAATSNQPVDCKMPLLSLVATGKNKGHRYDGDLEITIGSDGAIDDGTLTTEDGNTYDVVGQASGRAINLRVKLAADRFLSLIGTSEQDASLCRGRMDGMFGGWAESDLGTWTLGVEPSQASPTPAIASGNGGNANGGGSNGGSGNSSGGSGNSSGGGGNSSGGNPTPTPTPCTPQDCGGGPFVWLPDRCACGCMPPTEKCGDTTCCPAGSICDVAGASCTCPSGTTFCTDSCVADCPSGSNLNFSTCQCETQTSCGTGETLCNGACVSIACNSDQLFDATQCMCVNRCPAGQGFCGGVCIDIVNDRNNCGLCGNVCKTGVPCIAGTCECPATTHYDPGTQKCVAD